jgi:hypothetical protein
MGNNPNWTYDEFLAFTLLYASSVDAKISDDEVKLLFVRLVMMFVTKCSKSFPNSMNMKDFRPSYP